VRAGSIVPIGEPVENTSQPQKLAKVRVYPGADGDFTLYDDDGRTYAYEKGNMKLTHLHWDNSARKLGGADSRILEIVGH
jgi:alpha-D-xyloside xylohydrolase